MVLPDKNFFKIGEVAKIIGVKPHIVRYWEGEFREVAVRKTKSGQRIFSRRDVVLLAAIRRLVQEEKFTLDGARPHVRHLRRRIDDAPDDLQSLQGLPLFDGVSATPRGEDASDEAAAAGDQPSATPTPDEAPADAPGPQVPSADAHTAVVEEDRAHPALALALQEQVALRQALDDEVARRVAADEAAVTLRDALAECQATVEALHAALDATKAQVAALEERQEQQLRALARWRDEARQRGRQIDRLQLVLTTLEGELAALVP